MICATCTPKKCFDDRSIEIECVECRGSGCESCRDGHVALSGCPKKIASEVVPALSLIDLFEKGMPPVLGGVLDQSAWFINAAEYYQNEVNRIKAEVLK